MTCSIENPKESLFFHVLLFLSSGVLFVSATFATRLLIFKFVYALNASVKKNIEINNMIPQGIRKGRNVAEM